MLSASTGSSSATAGTTTPSAAGPNEALSTATIDPLNANRYAYAGADPINDTDPTRQVNLSNQCVDDLLWVLGGAYTALQLIGLLSGSVTLGFGTLVTTAFLLNAVQTAFDVASSTESCQ